MSIRRKVIQVSLSSSEVRDMPVVAALCDDGTIWLWDTEQRDKWTPLPRIPQTELPVPGR